MQPSTDEERDDGPGERLARHVDDLLARGGGEGELIDALYALAGEAPGRATAACAGVLRRPTTPRGGATFPDAQARAEAAHLILGVTLGGRPPADPELPWTLLTEEERRPGEAQTTVAALLFAFALAAGRARLPDPRDERYRPAHRALGTRVEAAYARWMGAGRPAPEARRFAREVILALERFLGEGGADSFADVLPMELASRYWTAEAAETALRRGRVSRGLPADPR